MASKAMALARPIWVKQAEEAKLKNEEEKAAAAKAAFEATFNDVERAPGTQGGNDDPISSDSEEQDESKLLASKPIGPLDPCKCTAAGTGVAGGAAGSAASFVVVTKDSEGRRVPHGGASINVRITPDASVGVSEQEAVVKDHGDGTYTATYGVTKRGNYMVSVECNGHPVQGSPFPVFFSGTSAVLPTPSAVLPFANAAATTAATPTLSGILGMVPGIMPGSSGGVVLPGVAASFGEVCQDHLNGRCNKSDCRFNHPPQQQLVAALASGSNMGGLSQMPMAPAAAAMAAAQSIIAAQAYQAAQVRAAAQQKDVSEMTKTLPMTNAAVNSTIPSSSLQPAPLPVMMQQAVAMQQLQFQQALVMQQAMLTQQAAARAASVKSATETAAARAAEISKRLKGDADDQGQENETRKSRSRSRSLPPARSRSRSRSPIKYRRDDRYSRYRSDYHSSSRSRGWTHHRSQSRDRASYHNYRYRRLDRDREYDRSRRRSRSRSKSRRRSPSISPRHQKESRSPTYRKEHGAREYSNYRRRPSKDLCRSISPIKESAETAGNCRSPQDVAVESKDVESPLGKQDIKLARQGIEGVKNHRRISSRELRTADEQAYSALSTIRPAKAATGDEDIFTRHSQTGSNKLKDIAEKAFGSEESRFKDETGTKLLRQLSSALQNVEEKETRGTTSKSEFCNVTLEESNLEGPRKKEKLASSSEENGDNTAELDDWRSDVLLQEKERLKFKDKSKACDRKSREKEDIIHNDSRDTLFSMQSADVSRQTVRYSSDSVRERDEKPDSSFENDTGETLKFTDVKVSSDSTFNRSLRDRLDVSDLDFPLLTVSEENKRETTGDEYMEHERKKGKHRKHSKKHRYGDAHVSNGESAEDEKEDQSRKEKKKHKKRHRKDDNGEKHEKKRKRHKHHRHQSPTGSSE